MRTDLGKHAPVASAVAGALLAFWSIHVEARAQVQWTLAPPVEIPGMVSAAMAHDSARGRTVLFGGLSSVRHDETWEWNGSVWIKQSTAVRPRSRTSHAMAYDARRGVVVLFGGFDADYLGDTWEYDGTAWTQRFPTTAPSGRILHHMAYDAARGVIVLFGGADIWVIWTRPGSTTVRRGRSVSPLRALRLAGIPASRTTRPAVAWSCLAVGVASTSMTPGSTTV